MDREVWLFWVDADRKIIELIGRKNGKLLIGPMEDRSFIKKNTKERCFHLNTDKFLVQNFEEIDRKITTMWVPYDLLLCIGLLKYVQGMI